MTDRIRLHPRAEDDIADVLAYTIERFGLQQYQRYEQIIEEALARVAQRPDVGRAFSGRAGLFLYSIGRRGQRASHQLLSRDALRQGTRRGRRPSAAQGSVSAARSPVWAIVRPSNGPPVGAAGATGAHPRARFQ